MRLRMALALVSLVGILSFAALATAAPVYGTDASGELNGSRDVDGGGLTGFNDWSTNLTVSWVIDFGVTTAGLWHYEYTITGQNDKDVSHIVFDVSDDCVTLPDPACVTNAMANASVIAGEFIEFGDKDGIDGAVKFDVEGGEGITYSFDSNRAPVYGDFALKDGGGPATCADVPGGVGGTNIACNNGMLAALDTEDVLDYIARPNGAIPEPGTGTLIVLGLIGLAGASSERRRATAQR